MRRRQALALLGGASLAWCWPARAAAPGSAATLLAAWQAAGQEHIGQVRLAQGRWALQHTLVLPTRAHGLLAEPGGGVLAVARRPGDWLLRWSPRTGRTQWQWVEDERRFNGHVIASADHRRLWTTETELEDAQGLLGLRDARSLEKTAEWPTHGRDPHQLMALPRAVGDAPAGALVVANGGIPTLPETGRAKLRLGEMDASLVLLDERSGALLGQWRLPDRHLSIRHLAFDATSGRLGIALQAEHPDAQARAQAPVLAVWDGRLLWAATGQPALAGYGGDIVALPGGGFAVSCPRADTVALYDAQGAWRENRPFTGAYALARHGSNWWVAGTPQVRHWPAGELLAAPATDATLQWDNHWVALG
jgi:hypothetical protein